MIIEDWNAEFELLWRQHQYGGAPIGNEQIGRNRDHWVRFHSLPQSKRYPESVAEEGQVFERFSALGNSLFDAESFVFYVHWWAHGSESDESANWIARKKLWNAIEWKQLLLNTAHDQASSFGVFGKITGTFLSVYDGGFDVFFRSDGKKLAFENQFASWFSTHTRGL